MTKTLDELMMLASQCHSPPHWLELESALRELITDAERWRCVLEKNADGSPTRAREFTAIIDDARKG